jgi:hypothetical protein
MPSRDWVMGDGLAAYLRSAKVYCKYNRKDSIRVRSTEDEDEKKYQDIIRWNPEGSRSVSISTLLRIHRSTRGLARCIKSQIGEKMRTDERVSSSKFQSSIGGRGCVSIQWSA